VSAFSLVWVPLVGLVLLILIGAGVTVLLSPRLAPDARAALVPVVGAAMIATASVLLPVGVPARPLVIALACAGVATSILLRRRVAVLVRAGACPLGVALAAVALAGTPSFARGDWEATSLYGSTDAYHWSSQARAYLDGAAAPPSSEHPDRLTYERSREEHWAVALPFGLLALAWLVQADPPDAYGAFAALLFVLLPLAAYSAARAVLGWSRTAATAAGIILAANAALLFATHFSWQQQVAGSAFAFAAATALRLGLEPEAFPVETILPALLTAAALATYRLGFAPFIGAVLAAVVLAYVLARRRVPGELARIGRVVLTFLAAFACLGALSLAALERGLPGFVSSGGFSSAFKRGFPSGQLAEAVGFVPRVWALEEGWPAAGRLAWLAAASLLALVFLVGGALVIRRMRVPRGDFLAAGVALTLVGYALLLLPPFSSYLSFKLLSYGAPFLVLLVLSPFALASGRTRALAGVGVVLLVMASASVATVAAARRSETAGTLSAVAAAAFGIPRGAVIRVALDDPWEQAWALYYLRDHAVSVPRASFLLTAQGLSVPAGYYRHGTPAYVLGKRGGGVAIWRDGELSLERIPASLR
jgi:hypothetical protein